MTNRQHLDIDPNELWEHYCQSGSDHRTGKAFGTTGDTVHQKLLKAGFRLNKSNWSIAEVKALTDYYTSTPRASFDLHAASDLLGRSYHAVALKANELGLTDICRQKNDEQRSRLSSRMKQQWERIPHPRGMSGKRHSAKTIEALSEASRRTWKQHKAEGVGLMSEENRQRRSDQMAERQQTDQRLRVGYSRGAMGRRADLGGMFFRSSWEANYARYLKMMQAERKILRWEFEPDTFWFEAIRRGVRSYLPDFKIWPIDGGEPYYVEVKGWMDAKSATKLRRMAKYYPHVRVDLVGQVAYKALSNRYGDRIPFWEKGKGDFVEAPSLIDNFKLDRPDWLD